MIMRNGIAMGKSCMSALAVATMTMAANFTPVHAGTLSAEQSLGEALFFDTSLSKNGTQACGSCHSPSVAFTDPDKSNPTSKGDNPFLFGNRNTPTVAYAAFSPEFGFDANEGLWVGGQFLDGRANGLQAQAKGPFLNLVEMGNSSRAAVILKLKNGSNAEAFKSVYGANIFDTPYKAYEKLATAIASYEKSGEVSPFTSKFDYVNKGQATYTIGEARGLKLFNDPMKGNCAACHISTASDDGTPALFTDFTYDNIGIPKNLNSDFLTNPAQFNPDGLNFVDLGLGGIVGDESLYGGYLLEIALAHPGWSGMVRVIERYPDSLLSRRAISLKEYLAVELASRNIIVNAVSPGVVETEALNFFPSKDQIIGYGKQRTPAGRLVEPEDVAKLVAFLCSDDARMIVGQTITIDGGYSILA